MSESKRLPRISIVMPSFNQAGFLEAALDSILGQDYPPFQVIVMDGNSSDGSREILARYAHRFDQLEWVSEPDDGPADAVNKGLARVRGDVIGIMSSDDIYYDGVFSEVATQFRDDHDCGFVYGHVDGVATNGEVLYTRYVPEFSWDAFFGLSMCIPQGSIFFRHVLAQQVGGWNGDIYGCDLDYWMRLLFHTRARRIDRVLSGWRRYPEQRTRPDQARRIWDDYWRMIEESDDLKQAAPRVQRLAQASKHLLAMRFPPRPSYFTVWAHMWRGWRLHPQFWRYNHWMMIAAALIPGFARLRPLYQACKALFGLKREVRYAPVVQPGGRP